MTEAFFVTIEIFGPVARQKFCVRTEFGAETGCLGSYKGPLVSRHSFPKVEPFLL